MDSDDPERVSAEARCAMHCYRKTAPGLLDNNPKDAIVVAGWMERRAGLLRCLLPAGRRDETSGLFHFFEMPLQTTERKRRAALGETGKMGIK